MKGQPLPHTLPSPSANPSRPAQLPRAARPLAPPPFPGPLPMRLRASWECRNPPLPPPAAPAPHLVPQPALERLALSKGRPQRHHQLQVVRRRLASRAQRTAQRLALLPAAQAAAAGGKGEIKGREGGGRWAGVGSEGREGEEGAEGTGGGCGKG